MKAFIAARGVNDTDCPKCGARLANRISACPRSEASDEKNRCNWRPGYWYLGRFWITTPTEFEHSDPEVIAQLKKCPDLVVVDNAMFEERPRIAGNRK